MCPAICVIWSSEPAELLSGDRNAICLTRHAWPVAQRVTVRRENVVNLDWHMDTAFRVERILLCPFCGEPVAGPADRASLTLKRANDCLVHWKIHGRCFVERIAAAAAERL